MLIDTGASHSFVDGHLLDRVLRLQPRNFYRFHSASTSADAPERCAAYDVSLTLGQQAARNLWRVVAIEVMGSHERRRHGLLGRDVLALLQFEWQGPQRQLVLLYP